MSAPTALAASHGLTIWMNCVYSCGQRAQLFSEAPAAFIIE